MNVVLLVGDEAIFEARSGRERVLILLEMAGHGARLHVAQSQVERLATAPAARGIR